MSKKLTDLGDYVQKHLSRSLLSDVQNILKSKSSFKGKKENKLRMLLEDIKRTALFDLVLRAQVNDGDYLSKSPSWQ